MNWVLLLLVNYRIQEKIEKEKKRDEKKRYMKTAETYNVTKREINKVPGAGSTSHHLNQPWIWQKQCDAWCGSMIGARQNVFYVKRGKRMKSGSCTRHELRELRTDQPRCQGLSVPWCTGERPCDGKREKRDPHIEVAKRLVVRLCGIRFSLLSAKRGRHAKVPCASPAHLSLG